jgi:hypothetical protein
MNAKHLVVVAALLAPGCASVDPEDVNAVTCPPGDPASFESVSRVLERRCGTLDCHGNTARPLRIYGQTGLRRPEPEDSPNIPPGQYADYYSGAGALPTTAAELADNALSVCGLEPELINAVVSPKGKADPSTLTFIRKARLTEKHKGGLIWNQGDAGDQCMIAWLSRLKDLNKDPAALPNTIPCEEDLSHP